ncbi:hypothetical protein [Paraburkholderia rhynchosiae]|uniref:Uncharacterized protein n=1 Tax=Paraburkholderia rhynchosiae TaxID=487049 RepID=A0ABX4UUE5_9BURK|nr:hypothetical protein [Paraburkholderia rhynchosiae]PMS19972.1 hypothetical protein C0Z16_35000 [Paraburkholderia rhynchosiae]
MVAAATAKSTSVDVPLEDFDNRLDDDFARRLGGMIGDGDMLTEIAIRRVSSVWRAGLMAAHRPKRPLE